MHVYRKFVVLYNCIHTHIIIELIRHNTSKNADATNENTVKSNTKHRSSCKGIHIIQK